MADSSAHLYLHVWPAAFGLSSIDPSCLAAVLYLQFAIPGRYSLVDCTTPDNSPNGQLPYISHDLSYVSSLSSIIKYVSGLPGSSDLNSSLTNLEGCQITAWHAHATSTLGDLVAYTFYSSSSNYSKLTHPTLSKMLRIPQRYYLPGRIRDSYRPRLQSVGLWDCEGAEEDSGLETSRTRFGLRNIMKESPKSKMKLAFAREQKVEKARTCLDSYSKLLGHNRFFFQERPSTLDIVVASHILLLLNAPQPDPLITDLLTESYPSLVNHARLVLFRAFPVPSSSPPVLVAKSSLSWKSLIPHPPFNTPAREKTDIEKQFALRRWGWFALALFTTVAYFRMNPVLIVVKMPDDAEEEVGEKEVVQNEVVENEVEVDENVGEMEE